jgi:hypothetical protein
MALDPEFAAAFDAMEGRIMKRLNEQQARNVAGFRSLNDKATGAETAIKALAKTMQTGFEGVRDRLDGIDRRLNNIETIAGRLSTDVIIVMHEVSTARADSEEALRRLDALDNDDGSEPPTVQ